VASFPVVIDASIAIKAILPNALQAQCQDLLAHLSASVVFVPGLWTYETTSALAKAVFFGDINAETGRRALSQILALGVQVAPMDGRQATEAFEWTIRLKRAAAYDSFYLSLAESLGCDLWTADRRLRNAVSLPWVRWVEDFSG
jgi:predicted nucleic acid-binding protein